MDGNGGTASSEPHDMRAGRAGHGASIISLAMCVVAIGVYLLDTFVLGELVLGLATGLVGLVASLHPRLNRHFAFVWVLMVVALLATNQWDKSRTLSQASQMADAFERFRAAQKRYPATLHELVPSYLPKMPSGSLVRHGRWQYTAPLGELEEPILCINCFSLHPTYFDFRTRELRTISR